MAVPPTVYPYPAAAGTAHFATPPTIIQQQSPQQQNHRQQKMDEEPITFTTQMRVPSHLIGRCLGKKGATIARVIHDTGAHVSIRNDAGGSHSQGDGDGNLIIVATNAEVALHAAQLMRRIMESGPPWETPTLTADVAAYGGGAAAGAIISQSHVVSQNEEQHYCLFATVKQQMWQSPTTSSKPPPPSQPPPPSHPPPPPS